MLNLERINQKIALCYARSEIARKLTEADKNKRSLEAILLAPHKYQVRLVEEYKEIGKEIEKFDNEA